MKKCKITRIMARKIPHLACFLNLEHWNNDRFFSWYENINLVIICQYLFRFSHIAVSIIDFQERKSLIANYIHVQICVYLIMICVQLYQCIYVFSEAYTYQKMDCKLCLYDNMCIHILHMYLWLYCSILVYHDM